MNRLSSCPLGSSEMVAKPLEKTQRANPSFGKMVARLGNRFTKEDA